MEKKAYLAPSIKVMKMEAAMILAGSVEEMTEIVDDIGIGYGGGGSGPAY